MDTPRKILLALALGAGVAGAFGVGAGVAGAQTDTTEPPAATEETPPTTDEAPSATEDDATEDGCDERGGFGGSADDDTEGTDDTEAAESASFSRL